jgi:hypothetical protein
MQKVTSAPAPTPSPEYVFQMALAREVGLSRLLVAYISTGVAFMLLPGTFLGVWNLISISAKQAAAQASAAWLQAHGLRRSRRFGRTMLAVFEVKTEICAWHESKQIHGIIHGVVQLPLRSIHREKRA